MSRWKTAAIAALLAATGIVVPTTAAPAAQAAPTDTTTVYMAPKGKCSNSRTGATPAQAVCDFKTANLTLEKKQREGQARGDVYVRMLPGTYQGMEAKRGVSISFSPSKGKKMYIVPSWFTNEQEAAKKPRKDYPVIDGASGSGVSRHNGVAISPDRNYGGGYYIGFLDIRNVNNGVRFTNGYNFRPNPQDQGVIGSKEINRGAVRTGNKAPNKDLTIAHNYISRTGNGYGTSTIDGYGPIQIQNTIGAVVKNNVMADVKKVKLDDPHGIYGYLSPDMLVEGNTFINATPTVLRYRMGGNWVVKNNTFRNSGNISPLSVYTNTTSNANQPPECDSQNGQSRYFGSNKIQNGLLSFWHRIRFDSGGSAFRMNAAANCKFPGRITAPEITNVSKSGTGGHKVTWRAPDNSRIVGVTKSSKQDVVRYHVYTGKDKTKGDTYGYGTKIATVPASQRTYTIPNTLKDGTQYVYVVAESRGGGLSPMLGNKMWMQ